MHIHEKAGFAKGEVRAAFVSKTGERIELPSRSNVITYSGADILARILGGDTTYIPKFIGFMYGVSATATTLVDPNLLPDATKRVHPWTTVTADVIAASANIIVAPLILNAGFTAESSTYTSNVLTVAAFTGTSLEYAFPLTSPYAPALATGHYFYQALLLNRRVVGTNVVYTPFSRVTLRNTDLSYSAKPAGFELSLYWTITFN